MKRKVYNFLTLVLVTVLSGFTYSANAQTYTCQGHYYGCTYNNSVLYLSAINKIEVWQDGNLIYKSGATGCDDPSASAGSGGHYNVMTTSPAFTLIAGSTYQFKYEITHPGNYTYVSYFMGYLDLNRDGKYTGTGEHISASWGGTKTQDVLHTSTYTIPCAGVNPGTTRIRFRADYQYGDLYNYATDHSIEGYMGETEEYVINIENPTSITADFTFPNKIYEGTDVVLRNTGNGFKNDWYIDGTWEANTRDLAFNESAGPKNVKLISENCLGKDSVTKIVTVITPSGPTVPDFVANPLEVQLYDNVQFYDNSSEGPTQWKWRIVDTAQDPDVEYTSSDKNPNITFFNEGHYDVCLSTYNVFGWSTEVCKPLYVKVNPFSVIDVTSAWGAPITLKKGTLTHVGGPTGPYSGGANQFTNYVTVIPCDAGDVNLTFKKFKMADDNDKVFIFDGTDINGTPLHPVGGFKKSTHGSKVPFTVTAKSGAFLIYYETDNSGEDEGFIIDWEAEDGPGLPPVANFDYPDTLLHTNVLTPFTNTSLYTKGVVDYEWSVDATPSYITKDIEHAFSTAGRYEVCMNATSCIGTDQTCKYFTVVDPTAPGTLDFEANNQRPEIDEVISYSVTNDFADNFEWLVYPEDYVNFENGTTKNDRDAEMSFIRSGCYRVTLVAWNSADPSNTSKTVVKDDYICVVGYCEPRTNFSTDAVSMSNVKLKDGSTVLIDNSSGLGTRGYTDYSNEHIGDVVFGKKYDLEISRSSTADNWNGQAWIDWNIDGDFMDAGEKIGAVASNKNGTMTISFTVPDYTMAFEGLAKLRIAVGYDGKTLEPCDFANIGEYEDYGIQVNKDNDVPVITLDGGSVVEIQVGSTWTEPGYSAYDLTKGDITPDVVVSSNLDVNKLGLYTIRYNVCDNSGNCAQEVLRLVKVVKDVNRPTISLLNPTINVNVSDKRACRGTITGSNFDFSMFGATAYDPEDGVITHLISHNSEVVDVNTVGQYIVTMTVHDILYNADTVYGVVNVVDNVAPVIIEEGPVNLELGQVWTDQTAVCDKYDDNPTLKATPGIAGMPNVYVRGLYPVTYTAWDASNNQAVAVVRNYRVDDFTAPVLDLHTADTIIHDVNERYYTVEATATDNASDDKAIDIVKTGTVDWHTIGLYTEMYTATDESGNFSTKTRYVYVVDREAPKLAGNTIIVPVGYEFWPYEGLRITDNYDNPADLMSKVQIVSQNVNVWVKGTYEIQYQVTDASGNKSNLYNRLVYVTPGAQPTVGINDLKLENQINVYPVPSNGMVTIDLTVKQPVKAVVVDMLGKEIANLGELSGANNSVDLSANAKGVYFIKFTDGEKVATKKVVIE